MGPEYPEKNGSLSCLQSDLLRQLIRRKKRILIPMLLFFAIFSFCLPLSVSLYPHQMSRPAPWLRVPWGWLYAFAQIFLTWLWGWLYWSAAKTFDHLAEEIRQRGET